MKNIIEQKIVRQYYNVGYVGEDRMKQIVDFVLASLVTIAMVSIVLLIIISHIVGGA